jgi:glucokinase
MTTPRAATGQELLAGIDVGGSKIAVLVTDPDLSVCARHLARTELGDPSRAIDQIIDALEAALAVIGAGTADLAAVGIGVPGRVEATTGTVSLAVKLGWE